MSEVYDVLDSPETIPVEAGEALRAFVGADSINLVTAYDIPTDGVSDVGALINGAAADAVALGKALVIPNMGFDYALLVSLVLPANLKLVLRNSPRFVTALSMCVSVVGADVTIEGRLIINGSHNNNLYHIQVQTTAYRFKADTIMITNGNSGVVFYSTDADVDRIVCREMRGTAVKFSGSGSERNHIGQVRVRNAAGFGVYGESSAVGNVVDSVLKYADSAFFTVWQIANRPEVADGRMGLESVGLTKGCDEWEFGLVQARKSGDAGISLSGDHNVVQCFQGFDCALNGISFIGNCNRVLGGWAIQCENGASFTPNAGGLSKHNVLQNFRATENRTYGIQNNDSSNYRLWSSGATGSETTYCQYGLNVYKTSPAVTTFGTSPPVHTSGTVSDGLVNWQWVNSDAVTLDADDNTCIGCSASGNGGDTAAENWNQQGTGRCMSIGHPPGTPGLSVGFSFIPASTSVNAGAARGVGSIDLQYSRLFANQTASGAGAGVLGKNNRASQTNAWAIGSNHIVSSTGGVALGGDNNTIDGTYASAIGRDGWARGTTGAFVQSNGRFGTVDGSAQSRDIPYRVQTTNATPTKMTSDGGAVSTSNRLILENNCAFYVKWRVTARSTGGECASFDVEALVKRDDTAASTIIVGSTITPRYSTAGASAWAVTLATDTTAGGLDILATGAAATSINWTAKVVSQEVL